ncbi:tryptophan 7-halogenase [Paractinoplanes ovalisporus]|uniref:tryptophan 7-halogenase n=1 Tax=Paractinoplanes ovalisporus TaxID=2810368 RepID=UPI0027DCE51D|nr:tryptophan 7-halogenase [Actinoplanes ovalisporus]
MTGYDVVVIGGGPSGSTVATFVAMQGHRVLLLEKEKFPRYQIGESLLPSTVNGICRLLGVSDALARAAFPIKRGGTFRWGRNEEPWTFAFGLSPLLSGDSATAYQVRRMEFDQILLDNARANGVEVREQVTVTGVVEDETGRITGVLTDDGSGPRTEIRAKWVVDASGHTSRTHRHVGGERHYAEFFRNLALFGYFEGGKRLPAPNSGNILAAAFRSGWFWYIPLSDTLTSVGAVLRPEALDRVHGDREKLLHELIAECPIIADHLREARRVTQGPYGEIRVRKDWSYLKDGFTRPGMILVGDAACFIDPVFSSGVHLATLSALLAARSINTMLAGTVGESDCLAEFESRYRREYQVFHDFLVAFYDTNQDEDSYFWKAKRISGDGAAVPAESFVELVGGIASREQALIDAVDRAVAVAGEDRDLLSAPQMRGVLREGVRVQVQAAVGGNADEQVPVRPGGLVPSADGMHWARPAVVTS